MSLTIVHNNKIPLISEAKDKVAYDSSDAFMYTAGDTDGSYTIWKTELSSGNFVNGIYAYNIESIYAPQNKFPSEDFTIMSTGANSVPYNFYRKFDKNFNILVSVSDSDVFTRGYDLDIDTGGNFYIALYKNSLGYDNIEKYSPTGTKIFGLSTSIAGAFSVKIDSSDNIYFGDSTTLYKYNQNQNLIWSYSHSAKVKAIAIDSSGNVYAGGDRNGSNITHFKITSTGSVAWTKDHGAAIESVALDSLGNPYFTGLQGTGAITTRKYNSAGTQLWTASHGDQTYGICVSPNYVYVGGVRIVANATYSRYNVRQYDFDGNLVYSYETAQTTSSSAGVGIVRSISVY